MIRVENGATGGGGATAISSWTEGDSAMNVGFTVGTSDVTDNGNFAKLIPVTAAWAKFTVAPTFTWTMSSSRAGSPPKTRIPSPSGVIAARRFDRDFTSVTRRLRRRRRRRMRSGARIRRIHSQPQGSRGNGPRGCVFAGILAACDPPCPPLFGCFHARSFALPYRAAKASISFPARETTRRVRSNPLPIL